jgi:isopenicillin N synthase-like dioxygenase
MGSTFEKAKPTIPFSIPTIRLDDPNAVSALKAACVDVGFFYLEGHGIDPTDLERVFDESRKLFDLPLNEKEALSDQVMSRGYTAMQEETLDPLVQTEGDTKEGYYIGRDIPTTDPRYDPVKLRGPNQWPNKDVLPHFQSTMEHYHKTMSSIGFQVVQLLAIALGLEKTYFDDCFLQEPIETLRLLHYAKRESKPEEGIFACGAHSDYGMLTLLSTDEHSGLQILYRGKWMDVPPKPHAFVVNLGDMLERWTNGLMKSTQHRVLTSGEYERYSIPFFYDPSFETVVECLDVCTDENNPPRYPPTTAGEHLVSKYHETHADFAPPE